MLGGPLGRKQSMLQVPSTQLLPENDGLIGEKSRHLIPASTEREFKSMLLLPPMTQKFEKLGKMSIADLNRRPLRNLLKERRLKEKREESSTLACLIAEETLGAIQIGDSDSIPKFKFGVRSPTKGDKMLVDTIAFDES